MKTHLLRALSIVGAFAGLACTSVKAQIIEFRATINSAQETTGSTSTATGWAVMMYDVATNKFDITIEVDNFSHTVTASHIHEAAPAVGGAVVTPFGDESVYQRNGNTLTATFSNMTYGGTPLTLLHNGAYVNLHSAAWPGGEVRGQLIAQPKRLVAVLTGDQEPGTPSAAYGAALITFDPGTNMISTRLNIYNFTNTLTNSHYHEAAPGVGGAVVHPLGGASVYTKHGNSYSAVFANQNYLGDPFKLLTGGAYLNVHSNISPGGEIRGQVHVSDELNGSRLVNVASRGWVGTGDQVLINGFVITGTDPVRVLVTARGPSLTAAGVSGALANPMLSLHDSSGREIESNDDLATTFSSADLASTGFAPTNANESALLLVLPPGVYTSVISGVGGTTGIALTEVFESRPASTGTTLVQMRPSLAPRKIQSIASTTPRTRRAPEFCVSEPLALITLTR